MFFTRNLIRTLVLSALLYPLSALAEFIEVGLGTRSAVQIVKTERQSRLELNLEALKAVDPQGWVNVELSSCGDLKFSVPYSSPSFESALIVVSEINAQGETLKTTEVSLTVLPLLEIEFSLNEKEKTEFDSPAMILLQPHSKPVTLRFVLSKETGAVHRIHGEGAIPHAPRTSLLSKVGDSYEAVVEDKESVSARYYCHNYNTSADTKRVRFNVDSLEELQAAVQFPLSINN